MTLLQCPACSSPAKHHARFCTACGAALSIVARTTTEAGVLPTGTLLAQGGYSVGKLLGRGGFGITYLGSDNRLGRLIALKEFFPAGAVRNGATVVPPTTRTPIDPGAATRKFLEEAKVLARFRHASIVTVHDMFEENNTAYMVMEYLNGETLLQRLERTGQPLPEADVVAITKAVVDALEHVHGEGVLHRDIKPDNIMLVEPHGIRRPVLIDFGAARAFVHGTTMRQSVVLSYSYAPLEQYAEQARRGPFTDVYALAATLYHVATGVEPPAATERAAGIALKRPRTLNPLLSAAFERAVLHGMEMKVGDRPQTMRSFLQALTDTTRGSTARRTAATAGRETLAPATPHMQRLEQLAQALAVGGATQPTKLSCLICQAAEQVNPGNSAGALRCAVCRTGELQKRLGAQAPDSCPLCLSGRLEPAKTSTLFRCPACHDGFVMTYIKRRQLIFFADVWAKCDACAADFDYHPRQDQLTLVELPHGPGKLNSKALGQTKSRSKWAALSGKGVDNVVACTTCLAEFAKDEHGSAQWIAVDHRPEAVPVAHRRHVRPFVEWAKLAHGVPLAVGTPEEQQLRAAARRELWAALVAGEYASPTAETSFAATKANGEKVLVEIPVAQVRETKEGLYTYDTGQLWITTRKLVYHGSRVSISIPLDKISACTVHDTHGMALLAVQRVDRAKPIYWRSQGTLSATISKVQVQVPLDATRCVELVNSLLQRS